MGVPTYGALLKRNCELEKTIEHLQSMVGYLKNEADVQRRVIKQLKNLLMTYSNPIKLAQRETFCDRNHFGCKILHSRFSLVKKIENTPIYAPLAIRNELPQ